MMHQSKFRLYSILGQIGVWVIFFMIYSMEEWEYSEAPISFLYGLIVTMLHAGMVYFHYYFLLPLYRNRKRILYFSLTLFVLVLISIASYYIFLNFPFDYDPEIEFWGDVIYNFFLLTLVTAVSSLYYFVEAWFENIKTESMLRSEKLQAELNFLKSQINPHFLFNTLNNIYAFAQTGNPKTAPMLERLSSMLRFIVYDCQEEQVALVKELETVEDLLEIYKMKNSRQKNINLSVEGVKGYHLIAPLIIVNFVENACKHSDAVSNPKGFLAVKMSVNEEDEFLLDISNTFKKKPKIDSKYQGLGLQNIQKRLELLYKDSYSFEEEIQENVYQLRLTIPLKRKQ